MDTHKEVMGGHFPGHNRVGTPGPGRMHRHLDARFHGESRKRSRFDLHAAHAGGGFLLLGTVLLLHRHLDTRFHGESREHSGFDRHAAHAGKGFLLPGILLLLAEEPSHGYTLPGRLMEMGIVKMAPPPPIVYRALHRLEKEGLAVSDHVDQKGKGPARKVYRLTDEGWNALALSSDEMKEIGKGIDDFRERYVSAEKDRQRPAEGGPATGKTGGDDNEDEQS